MIGRGKRQSKRRAIWARTLAALLTFAMLFTSSGFQVLASEFSADVVTFEQASDAEAAMRAQAAADAEAARLAAEAQASANAGAGGVPAGISEFDTFDIFSSEPVEQQPVFQAEEQEVKETKLVLKTEENSVQEEGEFSKLKVTYELGKDSAIPVETRMYIGSETVVLPQFDEEGKYVNPETGRIFLVKQTENEELYVEYMLQAGENFTEEFLFGDSMVEAGSSVEFNVVISAHGDVPADHEIQATPAKVIYALPKTEEPPVEETPAEEVVEEETSEEEPATEEVVEEEAEEETTEEVVEEEAEEEPATEEVVEEEAEEEPATEEVVEEEAEEEPTEEVAEEEAEEEPTEEVVEEEIAEIDTEEVVEEEAVEEEVVEEETTEEESEAEDVDIDEFVEYGTSFVYEDSRVQITATAFEGANIPKEAVFRADYLPVGSDAYNEAVAAIESQLGNVVEGEEIVYVLYDMYFDYNGTRIEPEDGLVEVIMNFKTTVVETSDEKEIVDAVVIHIEGETGEVEDLTETGGVEIENGEVTSLGFTTDSFSIGGGGFGLNNTIMLSDAGDDSSTGKDYNVVAEGNEYTLNMWIDDVHVDLEELEENPEFSISRDSKIDLALYFKFSDLNKPVPDDDTPYYYEIPYGLVATNDPSGGIEGRNNLTGETEVAGTYEIRDNVVYFYYLPEYVEEHQHEIAGYFTIHMAVDKSATADDEKISVEFPGLNTEVTINLGDVDLPGEKKYLGIDENGNFMFEITLGPADANVSEIVVTDTLSDHLDFVDDSFWIKKGNSASVQPDDVNIDGKTATITVGDLAYGEVCVITYLAKAIISDNDNEDYAESNTASWGWDGDDGIGDGSGHSSNTTVNVKDKLLLKEGQEGSSSNQIKYTIHVNEMRANLITIGEKQELELTDQLVSEVSLYLGTVKILDESGNPIQGARFSYDSITRILKFYIPDETYAIITYTVQVNGSAGSEPIQVINSVSMKGDSIITSTADDSITIEKSDAGLIGLLGKITLTKISKYAMGGLEYLPGAEFELYKIDLTETPVDMKGSIVETKVTREEDEANGIAKGTLVFGSEIALKTNTLYYFVETKAPVITKEDGTEQKYLADKTPHYFVIPKLEYDEKDVRDNDDFEDLVNEKLGDLASKVLYLRDGQDPEFITNDTIPDVTSTQFAVEKVVEGTSNEDAFTFKMFLDNYSDLKKDGTKYSYTASDDNLPEYESNVTINGNGTEYFDEIIFEYEGVYTFKVSETSRNTAYVNDETVHTVEVIVSRGTDGNLRVDSEKIDNVLVNNSDKKITFTNIKTTEFTLQKVLEQAVSNDATFNFTITGTYRGESVDFTKVKVSGEDIVGKPENNTNSINLSIKVSAGEKSSDVLFSEIPVGAKIVVTENIAENGPWKLVENTTKKNEFVLKENSTNNVATVTNSYTASGTWVPSAIKTLNGGLPGNHTFSFVLTSEKGDILLRGYNDENGEISFDGNISYSLSDIQKSPFKYHLYEEETAENGVTVDNSTYVVTVTLEDNGTGKIIPVAQYSGGTTTDIATFNNIYDAEGEWSPEITKVLEGGAAYREFEFGLYDTSGNKIATGKTNEEEWNDGKVTFAPVIKYTEEHIGDSFTYYIREEKPSTPDKDIYYDESVYEVEVTISDLGKGIVGPKAGDVKYKKNNKVVDDESDFIFTNRYKARGQGSINIQKTLTNMVLEEGMFEFGLYEKPENSNEYVPVYVNSTTYEVCNSNDEGAVELAVTNDADGRFSILTPVYTEKDVNKEYTYYLMENKDYASILGVKYDEKVYTITVTVKDDTKDGELEIGIVKDADNIVFANKYEAEGSFKAEAEKVIQNWNGTEASYNRYFEFALLDSEYNRIGNAIYNNGKKVQLPTIKYTKEDLDETLLREDGKYHFEYYLCEVPGNLGYISYSSEEYKYDVAVADNGNGKLEVTYDVYYRASADEEFTEFSSLIKPVFTNVYNPTCEVVLKGTKVLRYKDFENEEFTFGLYEGTSSEGKDPIRIAKNGEDNNPNEVFVFEKLIFDATAAIGNGEHHYVIKEIKGDNPNEDYEYDETEYPITITVIDDHKGGLEATVSPDAANKNNAVTVTNTYNASGDISFGISKTLNGRAIEAEQFKFILSGGRSTDGQAVFNGADGKVKFNTLTYDASDIGETYTYYIAEEAKSYAADSTDESSGYGFDETVYKIVITIEDNGDGTLDTPYVAYKVVEGKEEEYSSGDGLYSDTEQLSLDLDLPFSNKYEAEGSLTIAGKKVVVPAEKTFAEGDFSFEMYRVETDLVTGEIVLDNDGKEKVISLGTNFVVSNKTDGTFVFPVIEYNQDEVGKYLYRIEELDTNRLPGDWVYDDTVIEVRVEVSDNGDGTLKVDQSILNDDLEDIEFTNTYTVAASYTPVASKVLEGHNWADAAEFTFCLEGEKGYTQTVQNDGEDVEFNPITYGASDIGKTYHYTMSEVNTDAIGYTYSTVRYRLTVEVKDDGNGGIDIIPKYYVLDSEGNVVGNEIKNEEVVFTNSYNAQTSIVFSGTKSLNGEYRALDDRYFTFKLTYEEDGSKPVKIDANGRVIPRDDTETEGTEVIATNNADGTFSFPALWYDQEMTEEDGEYEVTYYISENVKDAYYVYDSTIYQVDVTITDKHNGTLEPEVKVVNFADGSEVESVSVENLNGTSINVSGFEFVNTYIASGSIQFKAKKLIKSDVVDGVEIDIDEGQFKFELASVNDDYSDEKSTSDDDAIVEFKEIKYNQLDIGKTYEYTLSENAGTQGGFTYSNEIYIIKVSISDNLDGTLGIAVNATNKHGDEILDIEKVEGEIPAFEFENEYHAKGSLVLRAEKDLHGRELGDEQFSFVVRDESGVVIREAQNDEEGNIVFAPINYTDKDIDCSYEYTVSEVCLKEGEEGYSDAYTYDETIYKVHVEVSDDEDGTLTPNVTYSYEYDVDNGDGTTSKETAYPLSIAFNNVYEADGILNLTAIKNLSGRTIENGQFEFKLSGTEIKTQIKSNVGNFVEFDTITYDQDDVGKEIIYVIEEVIPEPKKDGYTYDLAKYEIRVTVADLGDGDLDVSKVVTRVIETDEGTITKVLGKEDKIEFNNAYKAVGNVELTAKKSLRGRTLERDQFAFELTAGENTPDVDPTGDNKLVAYNDAEGNVTFDKINYTEADAGKTYYYKVVEVDTDADGYTYDPTEYVYEVVITDNSDGTLTTNKTLVSPTDKSVAEFVNTYKATGELPLSATKILTGRALEAGQFSFELKDVDGKVLQTKANDAEGKVTFGKINYTEADAGKEYVYTVSEVIGDNDAYTYDSMVYTVAVKVEDNGDGTLEVTSMLSEPNASVDFMTFTNAYKAEGELSLTATKVLNNRTLEADQFTFELKDAEGNVLQKKKNAADGSVVFAPIKYNETHVDAKTHVGEYVYTVSEVKENAAGYTYSNAIYNVSVIVTDNGKGDLDAQIMGFENVTTHAETANVVFKNTYEAEGSIELEAKKLLAGRELAEGKFEFELKDAEGNVLDTATNAADGTVAFDEITYKLNNKDKDLGYHTYTISEKDGKLAGYGYDASVYAVTVNVTDNGNGTLKAEVVGIENVTTHAETAKVIFKNTYKAAGTANVDVVKKLTGRTVEEGQFKFTLTDENGTVLQTKANAADGTVTFDDIVYSEADTGNTYTYTIKEVKPEDPAKDAPGYTYDETTYEWKVSVADEIDNGELEITEVVTRIVETPDGPATKVLGDDDAIVFNNAYEAKGSIVLTAEKILTGRALEDDKFEFKLSGKDIETQTVRNNGSAVTFEAINYYLNKDMNNLGLHTYTIIERNEALPGYIYSNAVYDVTVNVTDNGDGTLSAEVVSIENVTTHAEVAKAVFRNKYEAYGEVDVNVKKYLDGRAIEDGQFEFTLTDEDGNIIDKKSNVANDVAFDLLTYSEADTGKTFVYTINEVIPEEVVPGYTYDETAYEWKVTIADEVDDGELEITEVVTMLTKNEDGTVTRTVVNDDENFEYVEFNNIYEADGEVTITARKALAGRAIADGQFEFALSDEAGNVMETRVNEGNSVVFNTITYDESNVGQTFVYFVNEVIPEEKAPGYTYDETAYKVTVKVADDDVDGELEITKEIAKLVEGEDETVSEETVEVIEFNNIYKASGKLDLAAAKELIGKTLEKDQFTFVLESSGLRTPAVKQTKTNAADGTVTFDSIEFNESHVSDLPYSYKVYEVNAGKPGYTYDDVVYTVSVKVTDNGDGTLKVTPTFFKPEKVSGEGLNLGIAINPVEAITFTNTYKAEGSIVLDAEKVFAEGVQAKVEDGRFTFEISEKDGFTATAANVGNKVTFPEIKYVHDLADNSQPTVPALGEHTYTIKEINDSATNKDNTTVFFDETEYTVKVMVTDNGDGTLKAEVTSVAVGTEAKEAVKFVNDVTRLNITKVDITNDKELPGATLELKDAEGNVIESWTSDDKTHYIEDVLEIGKVYTLTETVAPEGYTYVTDFTFTIDAEGNVVTEGRKTVDEKGLTTILVEDAPIKATISKVDIADESKELVGASMQIMDAEGKEIVKTIYGEELKWVSAEEPKEITGLPAGKYILRETAAPDGYTIAEDIEFTVSADMTIENKVVMKNVAIRLEITKTGFTKDNKVVPLKGAMLEIRETKEDGGIGDIAFNVYGEKMRFESAEEAIALNGVKPGKYWLVETDAPDGYAIAEPIQITINEDMTVSQNPVKAIMEDCPIEVEVSKVDITTGEELPGATLQILTVKEDGTAGEIATTIYYVDDETTPEDKLEWVSGDAPRVIKGLAEGNYILREITAPAGYTVAVDVPFTVDSDLNVVNKVVMEDAPTEIVVSKTSLTGLAELEGAHLEIQDEEGNVVTTVYGEELSWVSGTVAKQIKGLPAGNYTLVETQSPDGYAYADDVEFTVTDEVGVVKVSMKDDTTKVEISKYDVTNEKELAGAHLILKDSEGTIVADWISNGTPKVLEGELIAGEEYTLSEVSAPAGYAIAKDITFTVNMDGTLQKVVMEDEVAEGDCEVIVQKIVMQDGKNIAVDYTFYTALFADEDCTERVTSVKPLYVSGSYTTSTIFTNLPYGTYYVAETDEFGNLMEEDSIIESIQVIDGKAELLPSQATAKSTIINHVAGFDDHFYKSGEIVVNKSVVNADGEAVLVDDTFYFALFTDAALTNMADAGIVELKLSNASEGVVIFSDLPLGIYYLAETDEDGVPVGSAFEYTVTVDSSYCKLDEENPSVERTIVNQTEEEPPAGTPTPTPTPPGYNPPGGNPPGYNPPTDNPPTSVPPVKTGDDTPVLPFAAGASASLLAAIWAAVLVLKRRRRNG